MPHVPAAPEEAALRAGVEGAVHNDFAYPAPLREHHRTARVTLRIGLGFLGVCTLAREALLGLAPPARGRFAA